MNDVGDWIIGTVCNVGAVIVVMCLIVDIL